MRVVAIDQGTSSTRGFVLDESGIAKVVCTRAHQQIYPKSGWVEHNPEELLQHVIACIEAAANVDSRRVDAIGINNQGESCLAWDSETGRAISPVIVWQDRRTEVRITQLKNEGAEHLTLTKAGLPLDPYFSASKLAWIMQNIPEAKLLLAKGRLHLGTTDAFFIYRLTGNFYTDITTASRTSLLNLETGQWDLELCGVFGVPLEALPEIKPSMGDFGFVKTQGKSVPLSACVVDQQASLYGHGCRKLGDKKITFGTGAFALAVTGDTLLNASDSGLLPTVAWQSQGDKPVYALDGGVYSASSALNWAKSLNLFNSFAEINRFDQASAISRQLVFVPALTGLGCPYWDGSAAGMWLGMTLDTSGKDMVQAILEGVAFRAAEVVDAMDSVTGNVMNNNSSIGDEISIDGGMSANPYFCQFLADTLQKRIKVQSQRELTAMGTALMAFGMAFGVSKRIDLGAEVDVIYEPKDQNSEAKALFLEAVGRSRNWR